MAVFIWELLKNKYFICNQNGLITQGGVTGVSWPALPAAIMLLACDACGHNAVGLRQKVAWPAPKMIF